jgi:hypothetical protein
MKLQIYWQMPPDTVIVKPDLGATVKWEPAA